MSRKLFSLSGKESIYFNDSQPKIEVVHCPPGMQECIGQLPVINQYFHESHTARLDKDYLKAIEALKHAFNTTYEIPGSGCDQYAELFRSTIITSMETLQSDLQQLTSGWFKAKRFQPSLEIVNQVLNEWKMKK